MRRVEAAVIFALIMAYIWWLRYVAPGTWVAILAAIVISHAVRREDVRWLGFRAGGFLAAARTMAPVLLLAIVVLGGGGLLLGTLRPLGPGEVLMRLAAYVPWGLFQQYLLNGYFVNRVSSPATAALLFAVAHLPNPLLVGVTLVGGWACARLYLAFRNLFVLGLAHGVVGFLLYVAVPDAISRHLRVGPGWFTW